MPSSYSHSRSSGRLIPALPKADYSLLIHPANPTPCFSHYRLLLHVSFLICPIWVPFPPIISLPSPPLKASCSFQGAPSSSAPQRNPSAGGAAPRRTGHRRGVRPEVRRTAGLPSPRALGREPTCLNAAAAMVCEAGICARPGRGPGERRSCPAPLTPPPVGWLPAYHQRPAWPSQLQGARGELGPAAERMRWNPRGERSTWKYTLLPAPTLERAFKGFQKCISVSTVLLWSAEEDKQPEGKEGKGREQKPSHTMILGEKQKHTINVGGRRY